MNEKCQHYVVGPETEGLEIEGYCRYQGDCVYKNSLECIKGGNVNGPSNTLNIEYVIGVNNKV